MTKPTCTGICDPGYYCPPASVDPQQVKCGSDAVYCPSGSGYVHMRGIAVV